VGLLHSCDRPATIVCRFPQGEIPRQVLDILVVNFHGMENPGIKQVPFEPAWTQTVYQVIHRPGEEVRVLVLVKFYGDPDRDMSYIMLKSSYLFLSRTFVQIGPMICGSTPSGIGARSMLYYFHSADLADQAFLKILWPLIYKNHSLTQNYSTPESFIVTISLDEVVPKVSIPKQVSLGQQFGDLSSYDIGFDRKFTLIDGNYICGEGPNRKFGNVHVAFDVLREFTKLLSDRYANIGSSIWNKKDLYVNCSDHEEFGYCYQSLGGPSAIVFENRFRYPLEADRWLVMAKAVVAFADYFKPPSDPRPKYIPSSLSLDGPHFNGDTSAAVTIAEN